MEQCCGSLTIQQSRKSGDEMSNTLVETEHMDIILKAPINKVSMMVEI